MKVEGYLDDLFATLKNKKFASFKIPTILQSKVTLAKNHEVVAAAFNM